MLVVLLAWTFSIKQSERKPLFKLTNKKWIISQNTVMKMFSVQSQRQCLISLTHEKPRKPKVSFVLPFENVRFYTS